MFARTSKRWTIAAVAAVTVAAPGLTGAAPAAHAAPPAQAVAQGAPAPAPDRAAGTITWRLVTAGNPTADQQDAYHRITAAMNAAVARYNSLSTLTKTINVHYNPDVATADGNINGTIRFGANRGYMTERTALHEIAHTLGVGQSGNWFAMAQGGTWSGPRATALVRQYDGANAKLSTGGGHFWPYGLNYESEFSQTAADRHVHIVQAMADDGM